MEQLARHKNTPQQYFQGTSKYAGKMAIFATYSLKIVAMAPADRPGVAVGVELGFEIPLGTLPCAGH
jgi:hypothetical protein